jgi:trans-2,3-dihydro-3-hydroxyanthranilate isomerase
MGADMKKECFFVDVFTGRPYAGNQLAVFPNADGLTAEQMQKLANEINYSETTFILKGSDPTADFDVRIFSIKVEMPFAGHPILGTAYVIKDMMKAWHQEADRLRLKTMVGVIPLEKEKGIIWMTQNDPGFYVQYSDREEIAGLVGVSPEDIADDLPVEEVSTGNNMLIIPIKSLTAVQRADGNVNNLKKFFSTKNSVGPYLFTRETIQPGVRVHTRFFASHLGIIEDAATGSAAGPLTGYLLKHRVFGESFEIENEQGIEMGRPSRILMRGEISGKKYAVKIGGEYAYVGRAEFII